MPFSSDAARSRRSSSPSNTERTADWIADDDDDDGDDEAE
jgi:hypothetical protein